MIYQKKKGFLLLEVGIVLVLLLIIVTLAIPQLSFLHKQSVKLELEKLYALCIYLQQVAIASNREVTLTFDEQQQSYEYAGRKISLARGALFGVIPGVHGPPSAPTMVLNKPITFVQNKIIFHPHGTMQAGTIYITDTQKTLLYALTAPVAHISYLRKYRYERAWMLLS